jgi:hypothetical protein
VVKHHDQRQETARVIERDVAAVGFRHSLTMRWCL